MKFFFDENFKIGEIAIKILFKAEDLHFYNFVLGIIVILKTTFSHINLKNTL